ncbi:hypothetical protein OKN36_03030 [Furfurilactobacillus sp. OKN36]
MQISENTFKKTDDLSSLPFVEKIGSPIQSRYSRVKRVFDVLFALILGIVVLPIILLFALFVKIDSKGGAFYSQQRVGYMGRLIKITKLRSMAEDADR